MSNFEFHSPGVGFSASARLESVAGSGRAPAAKARARRELVAAVGERKRAQPALMPRLNDSTVPAGTSTLQPAASRSTAPPLRMYRQRHAIRGRVAEANGGLRRRVEGVRVTVATTTGVTAAINKRVVVIGGNHGRNRVYGIGVMGVGALGTARHLPPPCHLPPPGPASATAPQAMNVVASQPTSIFLAETLMIRLLRTRGFGGKSFTLPLIQARRRL